MKTILLAAVCMFLTTTTTAHARQYRKLTRIVNENVVAVTDALNRDADNDTLALGGDFELRRLFLRVQAKVGFDIEFGKIELIPELELIFQKEKI